VIKILDDIEIARGVFLREKLYNALKSVLITQMKLEEKTISQLAYLSVREHHAIKEHLQRLNLMNIESNNWLKEFKSLKNAFHQYYSDEEKKVLEAINDSFPEDEIIKTDSEYKEAKKTSNNRPEINSTGL
jgi:thiamine pyrophosphate-dependent acetolactate synthase large subunit-like protein